MWTRANDALGLLQHKNKLPIQTVKDLLNSLILQGILKIFLHLPTDLYPISASFLSLIGAGMFGQS